MVQGGQREDTTFAVADHWSERIIDPCPADTAQNRHQGNAIEPGGFFPKACKSKGFVPRCPAIVCTLALKHSAQAIVGRIEDYEIGRRRHFDFEALRDFGLIVASCSNERDPICLEKCLNGILDQIASLG